MPVAPDRIWAFHDGPMVGYFVVCKEYGANVAEYVRADIATAEIERLKNTLAIITDAYAAAVDASSAAIDAARVAVDAASVALTGEP